VGHGKRYSDLGGGPLLVRAGSASLKRRGEKPRELDGRGAKETETARGIVGKTNIKEKSKGIFPKWLLEGLTKKKESLRRREETAPGGEKDAVRIPKNTHLERRSIQLQMRGRGKRSRPPVGGGAPIKKGNKKTERNPGTERATRSTGWQELLLEAAGERRVKRKKWAPLRTS